MPHEKLEADFASWMGYPSKNAVACSSGTAALHLALEVRANGNPGYILVPDFTMVACARAVVLSGLSPRFVECDENLLITPKTIDSAYTPDVLAVMPVHVYGRRCNMQGIHALANLKGIDVVEDLAEAHGIRPHPDTFAACWSFYQNKIVAGEEGGMVIFKDDYYANKARLLRCLGFTPQHDFTHVPRGHNYRMASSLARLVLKSLQKVDKNLAKRKQVEFWYDNEIPEENRMPARDVCWVYDIKVPTHAQNALVSGLNERGIQARYGFKPMSSLREFVQQSSSAHPVAETMGNQIIYLPVDPRLLRGRVGAICREVRRLLQS